MENIALVITELAGETDTARMAEAARLFKEMNLAAASDPGCGLHLADEDETPEIVHPGFGVLFVSFSIWQDRSAFERFHEKYVSENTVSAHWPIAAGDFPSLSEAFGRIWAEKNLSSVAQAAMTPALLQGFGRSWMIANIGNLPDAFAYDHWVGLNLEEGTGPEEKKAVSFFKHPFGKPAEVSPQVPQADAVPNSLQILAQQMAAHNKELDQRLLDYFQMDYARLATLVDWAQNAINWLYRRRGDDAGADHALLAAIDAQLQRWTGAQNQFVARRNTQFDIEVRQAYAKIGVDEDRRKDQEESDRKIRAINEETANIYEEIRRNNEWSARKRNRDWDIAFFNKPRKYAMIEVDDFGDPV